MFPAHERSRLSSTASGPTDADDDALDRVHRPRRIQVSTARRLQLPDAPARVRAPTRGAWLVISIYRRARRSHEAPPEAPVVVELTHGEPGSAPRNSDREEHRRPGAPPRRAVAQRRAPPSAATWTGREGGERRLLAVAARPRARSRRAAAHQPLLHPLAQQERNVNAQAPSILHGHLVPRASSRRSSERDRMLANQKSTKVLVARTRRARSGAALAAQEAGAPLPPGSLERRALAAPNRAPRGSPAASSA